MRKAALMAVAAWLALAPVAAQAMTVAQFLATTDALKAKGLLALGSPDIERLRGEVQHASDRYRQGLAADAAAGRAPRSCPPPKGQAHISSDDIVAAFSKIAPANRGVSVNDAFADFMTKRYPCPVRAPVA